MDELILTCGYWPSFSTKHTVIRGYRTPAGNEYIIIDDLVSREVKSLTVWDGDELVLWKLVHQLEQAEKDFGIDRINLLRHW